MTDPKYQYITSDSLAKALADQEQQHQTSFQKAVTGLIAQQTPSAMTRTDSAGPDPISRTSAKPNRDRC
jgi:hypothetical protein